MSKAKPTPADAALERVRSICMAFPAVEEKLSHGAPAFHVKGKLLLTFVDSHHDDGLLAVWCKSTLVEQRRLVARDPDQFYVPPYVGVQGWVGVRLDRPGTDWIGLGILVEEAWLAVAPARVREGKWVPTAPPAPPPERKTTDADVARKSLARVTEICLALPDATIEKESQHADFRARKKVFAYFLDNHHGDGIISTCVKFDKMKAAALVKKHPERFHLPAYIASRGWLGVRVDTPHTDWDDLTARIAASYELATAPPKRSSPKK